ncbi:hypothetical protein ACFV4Q_26050 [Streptomyces nojiriensis]|uniref:hypothetical protein n=1 Tax=Streptomyces nojiriensis TaxID=66374 RepID=UPI0036601E7E
MTYTTALAQAKADALRAANEALTAQQDDNPFESTPAGYYLRRSVPYSEVEATLRAAGIHLNSRQL